VEDVCTACSEAAELLATGAESSFQNKVHLFMEAHGHGLAREVGPAA
jgi:peptidyl-tRNA hydrolase, PTH1 family